MDLTGRRAPGFVLGSQRGERTVLELPRAIAGPRARHRLRAGKGAGRTVRHVRLDVKKPERARLAVFVKSRRPQQDHDCRIGRDALENLQAGEIGHALDFRERAQVMPQPLARPGPEKGPKYNRAPPASSGQALSRKNRQSARPDTTV